MSDQQQQQQQQRRMSSQPAFGGSSSIATDAIAAAGPKQQDGKENEKRLQMATTTTTTSSSEEQQQQRASVCGSSKQSLLGKLANRGSQVGSQGGPSPLGRPVTRITSDEPHVTECDKTTANKELTKRSRSSTKDDADKDADKKQQNSIKTTTITNNNSKASQRCPKDNEDEDEDDVVIPSWPSKQEQLARNASSEFIQHKVYSLKDYSQVASPTAVTAPPSTTGGAQAASSSSFQQQVSSGAGKLLKSMSQDRKVKSSSKRMSECVYPTTSAGQMPGSLLAGNSRASASGGGQAITTLAGMTNPTSSASFSVGQASPGGAGGSLLPAASSRNSQLMCESRIDRMRKLFVSPLSLRSSASGSTATSSAAGAAATASAADSTGFSLGGAGGKQREPRLSFQATASKPAHHLMHAMYARTGAGLQAAAHHGSRRSPMRQKQGKGFRVYGCPLQMANNIYPITCFGRADIYKQQSVPYVLARLCNYIEENSSQLTHEGIFRVSGNARLMEKLRTLFDHLGDAPLESESVDVATSASMLKMYLRELPEPLIPTRMNYYFITLAKKYAPYLSREQASSTSHALQQQQQRYNQKQQQQQHQQQHQQQASAACSKVNQAYSSTTSVSTNADESSSISNNNNSNNQYDRQRLAFSRDLTKLIRKLPIENYNLLKYLACFLYRISLRQQYNKMCAEALGIVFGPNVFRIRSESYKGLKEQELSNQIMASIISNYKLIFDSELTDPLGNVVDANDDALVVAAAVAAKAASQVVAEQQKRKQQQQQLIGQPDKSQEVAAGAAGADLLAQAERLAQRADQMKAKLTNPIVSIKAVDQVAANQTAAVAAVAQPSLIDIGDGQSRGTCCPGRCKDLFSDKHHHDHKLRQPHPNIDDLDDDDDDEDDCDDDVDDDDVHDDDDEESYTPSSGSGSYCSSMDSETLESSYDGEGTIEGRRRTAHHVGEDLTSRSTSECASDTSYTPTSSHSDSDVHDHDDDDDDEDDDDDDDESSYNQHETSSLESIASINRPVDSQSIGPTASSRPDCRVCKRRESLQITSDLAKQAANGGGCRMQPISQIDATAAATAAKLTDGGFIQPPPVIETSLSDTQLEGARISRQREQSADSAGRKSPADSIGPATNGDCADLSLSDGQLKVELTGSPIVDLTTVHKLVPAGGQRVGGGGASGSARHGSRQVNRPATTSSQQLHRRRSSSASSMNQVSFGEAHHNHPHDHAHYQQLHQHQQRARALANHQKRQLGAVSNDATATATSAGDQPARYRSQLRAQLASQSQAPASGSGGRKSRGPKRQSRHSMRARKTHRDAANTTEGHHQQQQHPFAQAAGGRRARNEPAERHRFVPVAPIDSRASDQLTPWGLDLLREQQAAVAAATAACPATDYEEPDSPVRYFLMRAFNSDETLLRSMSYRSELPRHKRATQLDSPSAQALVDEAAPVRPGGPTGISTQRRFSNFDFITDKPPFSTGAMVCPTHCEQIFGSLDMVEEGTPPIVGQTDSSEREKVAAAFEAAQPAAAKQQHHHHHHQHHHRNKHQYVTSAISLIDNKIGFRKSELSMNNLDEQSVADSSTAADRPPANDAILVQMMATKELIKALKRQLKLGKMQGFSKEMEQLLLRFSNSEEGLTAAAAAAAAQGGLECEAYSDDCLACYVDHHSVRGFVDELEATGAAAAAAAKAPTVKGAQISNTDVVGSGGGGNSIKADQLSKILAVKITLFRQRYNDLKNIRDHYLRHHAGGALLAALNSPDARRYRQSLKKAKRVHTGGSLDTLRLQEQLHAGQPADKTTGGASHSAHRSRILSVPNRESFRSRPSSSGARSRSAMASEANTSLLSELLGEAAAAAAAAVASSSGCAGTGSHEDLPNWTGSESQPSGASSGGTTTTTTAAAAAPASQVGGCQFGSLCPVEFVFNIEKQLALKRTVGNRVVRLNQMSTEQLQSEKLELQKNLLRYEHWFGRPVTRLEFSLIGHLYERYRAVKMIKQRKQQQQHQTAMAATAAD